MNETVIDISKHAAAIFGYGSLVSRASLEQTLGRRYEGPYVPAHVEDWRRCWDVVMPNPGFYAEGTSGEFKPEYIIYLNVTPRTGSLLNGMLFVVEPPELEAMDTREWIYDRWKINEQLRGVTVVGGDAYIYVAKPQFVMANVQSPARAAVRASYLEILEAGFAQLDESFRQEFDQTSDEVPRHLVVRDKRRP